MTRRLPSGSVTFLFTDVEGSTRLLHELGPERYADALAAHRRVLRTAFAEHGGVEVDTQGDAFFVAFPTASGAIAAAARARDDLAGGPIRVRIGVHTGTPLVTGEGYVGPDVHRAARIAAAGHGGQILVSKETRDLLDAELLDLGEHRLKDFAGPTWIFQLGPERFPPLNTIANTNLPRPASTFVGRDAEIDAVVTLIRSGARLLTLTGPGGAGKTRLAIEAGRRLVDGFRAGVFWVELAPIRDAALASDAIANTLGARDGIADHIGEREMLLVLDNLEQVISVGPHLAELVERCPNLRLLVTSRERLRVRGEREYAVPPLAEAEAVALFATRAGVEPDPAVRELCRALDNLPLAIELAASRAAVLSPTEMLERLAARLDLFRGGRDADPRQQTLRATIDWSHELLSAPEQRLFARLSVFAGGSTLEAAERVADADLDTLGSLVDRSLVRHTDDRFWMLESIRGYASERLDRSGESAELRRRHARHYLELAERVSAEIESGEPEEGPVAQLEAEIDNIRSAVAFGLETGDHELVRRMTAALPMYWVVRGLYAEARSWLERALALDDARDATRRRLLSALGTIAYAQGDHVAAIEATDAAAFLAAELGGAADRIAALRERAFGALRKGEYETAEALLTERLGLTTAVGNGVAASSCRLNLALIANKTHRPDRAEALLVENLTFVRSKGQARCEAHTLAGFAETAVVRDRPQDGLEDARRGARLGLAIGDPPLTLHCLELVALGHAARGERARGARILGAADAAREALRLTPDEDESAIRELATAAVGAPDPLTAEAREAGRALDLAAVVAEEVGADDVASAPPARAVAG